MSVYETISLMIMFAMLVLAIKDDDDKSSKNKPPCIVASNRIRLKTILLWQTA